MSSYHVGLDLGQSSDYTAIAIVEHVDTALNVRHLRRFPLGTTYPVIVEEVAEMISKIPVTPKLVVDATGVGRPVVDLLRARGLRLNAVTITGGDTATHDGMNWRVPKRDLVSAVAVGLQTGRLKIAANLPEAATLTRELLNFKVTIDLKTAHDSYSAWRESVHDDLVLAVALSVWSANQFPKRKVFPYPCSGPRTRIPTMGSRTPGNGTLRSW